MKTHARKGVTPRKNPLDYLALLLKALQGNELAPCIKALLTHIDDVMKRSKQTSQFRRALKEHDRGHARYLIRLPT